MCLPFFFSSLCLIVLSSGYIYLQLLEVSQNCLLRMHKFLACTKRGHWAFGFDCASNQLWHQMTVQRLREREKWEPYQVIWWYFDIISGKNIDLLCCRAGFKTIYFNSPSYLWCSPDIFKTFFAVFFVCDFIMITIALIARKFPDQNGLMYLLLVRVLLLLLFLLNNKIYFIWSW